MSSTNKLVFTCLALLFGNLPSAAADIYEPIPMQYFGMHIHRADQGTPWPNIPFGTWRLWDAYVTWAQIEPRSGRWEFSRLDRYVEMANLMNVDILLPLGTTPQWAASRPNEPSSYQLGNASEPRRIEDWRQYVRTVAERYKGRIKHYEIWNEPNIRKHFSGDPGVLVALTCEASKILKSVDPDIKVVSPSSTAGAEDHIAYLDNFLSIGGRECIDIVGHHFYVPNAGPEAIVPLIRKVRSVMKKHGIESKPLWNTETGWWIANSDGTPDHAMVTRGGWKKLSAQQESGDYLFRAFLLARSEGVERFYWYSWDNPYGLSMIEPTSKEPKPMVEKWRSMVSNLVGSTGLQCIQAQKMWQCTFVTVAGVEQKIFWATE